jgi:gluconolactonase
MPTYLKSVVFAILVFFFSCKTNENPKTDTSKYIGHISVIDPALLDIIDSTAKIEILADSFIWSEGPLWLEKEQKLIFTDVPQNTIYSWDAKSGKHVYLKPSGYTIIDSLGSIEGANGLALDLDGNLLLCQHGNRALARMKSTLDLPKPDFEFLATTYKSKKFNSPNDLHVTRDGEIFFTDPPYGLPGLDTSVIKQLSFNGVYRRKKDGSIILIDSTLSKPNGIVFSADERTMYVANSDPNKAMWRKYTCDEQKNILSSSTFADVTLLVPKLKGLPDGMKIGMKGHIFASGPGGILIFNPDGKHLGTVMTENATANCALDTKNEYLYMTAHSYLMRVKLK